MANYATDSIRTIALVGHGAPGKTTLAEALLVEGRAPSRPRAASSAGTTVSDFDPLEKQYQHSFRSSILHLDTTGTRVHLIDTPGFPDFIGQSIGALDAVETAAIVVNAQSGIEMITSRMMAWAAERKLCRVDHRQQDRRRQRRRAGAARRDSGSVRQGMPADQPARRRRQARRRLLLQSVGRVGLLVGRGGTWRARRPGRRGRRGADVPVSREGRSRAGAAARAIREGAARGTPRARVLRVGAHRRRRAPSS